MKTSVTSTLPTSQLGTKLEEKVNEKGLMPRGQKTLEISLWNIKMTCPVSKKPIPD